MTSSSKRVCAVLVLLSIVYESTCINCYYCNSANNSACTDLKALDKEVLARIIPIVTCESAIPSPIAVSFFCRKITQTIYHSRSDSELRVTRGCGWVRHHQDCYRANNMDHLETVCQCFEDQCNSGERVDPAVATGLFLSLSAVLYFYR